MVPVGERVDLGDRGSTYARIAPGPPDATPVLLLHGLTAGSGINWIHMFEPLSAQATVIAPDLRGHGNGPHMGRRTSMEDNARDCVALLDELDIDEALVVGFSMGGAVAQELARIAPERVRGVVLVATAMRFVIAPITTRLYGMNAILARAVMQLPGSWRDRLAERAISVDDPEVAHFFIAESAKHSPAGLVRSAKALKRFRSAGWIGDLEVPTAVVIARDDKSLSPKSQRKLADAAPGDLVFEMPTGHAGMIYDPDLAIPVLRQAIETVS